MKPRLSARERLSGQKHRRFSRLQRRRPPATAADLSETLWSMVDIAEMISLGLAGVANSNRSAYSHYTTELAKAKR
jgi:hypothetical protein